LPELPDVETYRRYLAAHALHQGIAHVKVSSPRQLAGTSPQGLRRALVRRRFESTRRHGKHLFARIGKGRWLMLHFGMTGSLSYDRKGRGVPPYTRLRIDFGRDRQLAFLDPRKLGRIALTDSPRRFIEARHLGPDALALDRAALAKLAAGTRGAIKSWLMDQHAIAGIGNIYADEILVQARIHPRRSPNALERRALGRLFTSLGQVLRQAIAAGADPARMPKSFLLSRRKRGARCPRCGGAVERMAIGGRSTYYCPSCQRQ
jgi:formamidopyrimidine-DNA glycosylase